MNLVHRQPKALTDKDMVRINQERVKSLDRLDQLRVVAAEVMQADLPEVLPRFDNDNAVLSQRSECRRRCRGYDCD